MPNITTVGAAAAKAFGFTSSLGASPTGTYFLSVVRGPNLKYGAGYIKTVGGYRIYGAVNVSGGSYPNFGTLYEAVIDSSGTYISSTVIGVGTTSTGYTYTSNFSNVVVDGYSNIYVGGGLPTVGINDYTPFIANINPAGPYGVDPDPTNYSGYISTLRVSTLASNVIWAAAMGPQVYCSCNPMSVVYSLYKFTTSGVSNVVVNKFYISFGGIIDLPTFDIAPVTGYLSLVIQSYNIFCGSPTLTATAINVVNSDNTSGINDIDLAYSSGTDYAFFRQCKIDSDGNIWALVQQNDLTYYYLTLVKFDSSGTVVFQRKWTVGVYSATTPPNYFNINFDSYKNVYVTYRFASTSSSPYNYRVAILKFNRYGTVQYTRNLYSTSVHYGNNCGFNDISASIENNASIIITGAFNLFNSGPSEPGAAGIIRLPANGSLTQSFTLGTSNPTNMVYAAGSYVVTSNTLTFTNLTPTPYGALFTTSPDTVYSNTYATIPVDTPVKIL